MTTAGRIVNPYLSRKKKAPAQHLAPAATPGSSATKPTKLVASKAVHSTSAKGAIKIAITNKKVATVPVSKPAPGTQTQNVVDKSAARLAHSPKKSSSKPSITPASNSNAGTSYAPSLRQPKSLKQKLKQEIENLKRAKMIQKHKAEEKKRRREQELLRRKAQERASQQSSTAAIPTPSTAVKPTKPQGPSLTSPVPVARTAAVVSAEKASPVASALASSVALDAKTESIPSESPTVSSPRSSVKIEEPTTKSIDMTKDVGQHAPVVIVKEVVSSPVNATATQIGTITEQHQNTHEKLESVPVVVKSCPVEESAILPTVRPVANTSGSTGLDKSDTQVGLFAATNDTVDSEGTAKDFKDLPCPELQAKASPTLSPTTKILTSVSGIVDGSSKVTNLPTATSLPQAPSSNPHPTMLPPTFRPIMPHQQPIASYHANYLPYYGMPSNFRSVNPVTGLMHQPQAAQAQWYNNPWYSYLGMGNQHFGAQASHGFTSPYMSSFGFALPSHMTQPMYGPRVVAPQQLLAQTRAPPVPKPVEPKKLSKNVLQSPSPFATTHELVAEPIELLKEEIKSTFGISMSLHSESALVEPEWLDRENGIKSPSTQASETPGIAIGQNPTSPSNEASPLTPAPTSGTTQPRRRRRRRHIFSIMMVSDSEKQNQRGSNRSHLLQKGDIILKVQGSDTAGLTFVEACKLFALPDSASKQDGWYRIRIVIARRRPPPPPKIVMPLVVPVRTRSATTADVSRFALLRLKYLFRKSRLLGKPPKDSELDESVNTDASLSDLSFMALEAAWQKQVRELNRRMNNKAMQYWTSEWEKELPAIRDSVDRSYLSLSSRSRMRAAARPANACKCGSKSHLFVNDAMCPLYSNLRRSGLVLDPEASGDTSPSKIRKIRFQDRKLKTVEAAFSERVTREKAEREQEEAEALFVDEAERIQLSEMGQSIFSPSLTSMIVSCIASLKKEFESIKDRKAKAAEEMEARRVVEERENKNKDQSTGAGNGQVGKQDDDDDDDDDDVPLFDLGKRAMAQVQSSSSKKTKLNSTPVDFECLGRILQYCSRTWGHVFREPGDMDYAWRWELFHGQIGTSNWDTSARNPRKALSLENAQFLLVDETLKHLQFADDPKTPEHVEAAVMLSFLCDPTRTGILDEILALHQSEVVRIDSFGVPRLSSSWFKNVDVLVLEEMMACWGRDADPEGRYAINETVRSLSAKWIRHEEGWALTSDPDDIVYDSDEFGAWRNAFQSKHEEKNDDFCGVGRFGI